MKKRYTISEELKPWIEKILEDKKIFFLYRGSKISADISGRQFHKIVTRARCEKKNFEDNLPDGATYWVPKIESEKEILNLGYSSLIEYSK